MRVSRIGGSKITYVVDIACACEPLVFPGLEALQVPVPQAWQTHAHQEIRKTRECRTADRTAGIILREPDPLHFEARADGVFASRPGDLIAKQVLIILEISAELILPAE